MKIKLDKEREFLLDLNAMSLFEEKTGKTIDEGLKKFSAANTRALLWSGLVHEDPGLTIEYVGSLVTVSNMVEVSDVIKAGLITPPLSKSGHGK